MQEQPSGSGGGGGTRFSWHSTQKAKMSAERTQMKRIADTAAFSLCTNAAKMLFIKSVRYDRVDGHGGRTRRSTSVPTVNL